MSEWRLIEAGENALKVGAMAKVWSLDSKTSRYSSGVICQKLIRTRRSLRHRHSSPLLVTTTAGLAGALRKFLAPGRQPSVTVEQETRNARKKSRDGGFFIFSGIGE